MTDPIVDEVGGSHSRSRPAPGRAVGGATVPIPLTSFIGRKREVIAVEGLLRREDVRLVTLVGPAGIGKTRLAIQVATEASSTFADGARLVPLASVLRDDLVITTIARHLGVWESAHRTVVDLLNEFLRPQHILLVLDNMEQVIRAAPALTAVLSACSGVKLLVTSRASLRVSGEHLFPIPPLEVPNLEPSPGWEALEHYEAVRLFVQRAGAVHSGFVLDATNAESIAAVCRRLEGLPLAIELAAARVAHLPVRAIQARLTPALPLLTGGPADVPLRQRTMRDAVAWSYELLGPDEQRVLQRLSVFVGGCSLDAAAAVALSDRLEGGDILALMSSLVDQSLLSQDEGPDGEARYTTLEAIREFGMEQLALSGDEEITRRAHADHFLLLAETAAGHLVGDRQREWLDRLEAEVANIRVAIHWRQDRADDQRGLRMSAALAMLWYVRNHLREGWDLAQRALAVASEQPTLARAGALRAAGMMAFARGEYPVAASYLRSSLPIAEIHGDQHGLGRALFWLALVAEYEGDDNTAAADFQQALELFQSSDDALWSALTLSALGDCACRLGDLDRAEELCAEGMRLARTVGDGFVIWNNLQTQGNLELARKRWDRAARLHWEELSVAQDIGDLRGVADGLAGIAGAAVGRQQHEPGARLLGAADRLRLAIGRGKLPGHAQFERAESTARAALGDSIFQAAWDAGAELSVDEAIALAQSMLPVPDAPPTPGTEISRHGLSPREIDVLRLVVEGRSDRDIADELFISRRTAAGHVASILGKLDAVSRTDAAVRAVRRGIV